MKVLFKIILNICIIILAFFLGRVSNVCVTSTDVKEADIKCDCGTVNNSNNDAINTEKVIDSEKKEEQINSNDTEDTDIELLDIKDTGTMEKYLEDNVYTDENSGDETDKNVEEEQKIE